MKDKNRGNIDQCADIKVSVYDKGLSSDFCVNEDKGTTTTNDGQSQLDTGARRDTPTNGEDLKELEEREMWWNETKHRLTKEKGRDDLKDQSLTLLSNIKMPPKMLNGGRPKGAEVTVIGLPKAKKKKGSKVFL